MRSVNFIKLSGKIFADLKISKYLEIRKNKISAVKIEKIVISKIMLAID